MTTWTVATILWLYVSKCGGMVQELSFYIMHISLLLYLHILLTTHIAVAVYSENMSHVSGLKYAEILELSQVFTVTSREIPSHLAVVQFTPLPQLFNFWFFGWFAQRANWEVRVGSRNFWTWHFWVATVATGEIKWKTSLMCSCWSKKHPQHACHVFEIFWEFLVNVV